MASSVSGPKPYPFAWNLIPLLGGVIDPFLGVLGKIAAIFWQPQLPACADSPTRRKRGLTLILGGIEGPSIYNYSIAMGVLQGRYRGAVVRFDWNAGLFGVRSLVNLMSRRHHRLQCDRLVEAITNHARAHPESPICLVAQSGGCWIVIRALERLPESLRIHTVVLLAAAVSPGYDITLAASKCSGSLTSIGAIGDYFFLGFGTMLFGTSDRAWSPSAGLVGWHYHPPHFVESRWHPSWTRLGYVGNHVTSSAAPFVREVVVPMLGESSY
jgi:hypothetical protein